MSAPPSVSSLAKDNGGTFPMEVELRARFRFLEKVIGELLLRRDAHRFPFRELHCPVMPDFPAFPADFYVFDGGQRNVKNRNFQPCC